MRTFATVLAFSGAFLAIFAMYSLCYAGNLFGPGELVTVSPQLAFACTAATATGTIAMLVGLGLAAVN